MILPRHEIEKRQIVTEFIGESQFQPCGVDLTLKEVQKIEGQGSIDFDNSERVIPKGAPIMFEHSWVNLAPGCYKVIFNEHVKIPSDAAGFAYPRSSLTRCGAMLGLAVWDPGYQGRSEALLIIANPAGLRLKKNAKIAQITFSTLTSEAKTLYSGIYQGENTQKK